MPPGARPRGVCRFFRHLKQAWSCAPGLCRVGSQAADVALVSGTGKIGRRSRGLRQVAPGSVSQRGPLARADGELETRSSDHRCPGSGRYGFSVLTLRTRLPAAGYRLGAHPGVPADSPDHMGHASQLIPRSSTPDFGLRVRTWLHRAPPQPLTRGEWWCAVC